MGKLLNEKHFTRICNLIDPSKVVCGGDNNPVALQIAPTVMDNVTFGDAVMQEEIFGPVLPVLTYDSLDEHRKGQLHGTSSGTIYLHLRQRSCGKSYFPLWIRRRMCQ